MSSVPTSTSSAPHAGASALRLWAVGSATLWAAYVVVFMQPAGEAPARAAAHAAANVAPLSALAVGVRAVLTAEVMRRPPAVQALSHAALAAGFAFTWYATLVTALGLLALAEGRGFVLEGLTGPALTWQVFQGLALYAAVAAVCYALRPLPAEAAGPVAAPAGAWPRYLVRTGEDMTPVEVADIVSLSGAEDYVEVATLRGRHLVRLPLAAFEARLDPAQFVRVHRSTIINLAKLERAEPAGGGRLLAHMADGGLVAVSRSGARALRRFAV